MSLVAQFLVRYPAVDGYTLICMCEHINRKYGGKAGINGILEQALKFAHAGNHLAQLCISEQNLNLENTNG
jgi:hypothetical protein